MQFKPSFFAVELTKCLLNPLAEIQFFSIVEIKVLLANQWDHYSNATKQNYLPFQPPPYLPPHKTTLHHCRCHPHILLPLFPVVFKSGYLVVVQPSKGSELNKYHVMIFHYYYTHSNQPSTSSLRQHTAFYLRQRTAFPSFHSPNHVPALFCGCLIIGNHLSSFLAFGTQKIIIDSFK